MAGRWQRALLTLLRIAIGWHFLYEGHAKFMQGHWTSAGYLDASRWWFGGVFQWMAAHAPVITIVDAVNIGGQVVIGILLITGTLTRAASLAGVALLLLYYLANPPLVGLGLSVPADGHYLVVDRNLIEMLTLAFFAALPATALPGHRPLVPDAPAPGARRARRRRRRTSLQPSRRAGGLRRRSPRGRRLTRHPRPRRSSCVRPMSRTAAPCSPTSPACRSWAPSPTRS